MASYEVCRFRQQMSPLPLRESAAPSRTFAAPTLISPPSQLTAAAARLTCDTMAAPNTLRDAEHFDNTNLRGIVTRTKASLASKLVSEYFIT